VSTDQLLGPRLAINNITFIQSHILWIKKYGGSNTRLYYITGGGAFVHKNQEHVQLQ